MRIQVLGVPGAPYNGTLAPPAPGCVVLPSTCFSSMAMAGHVKSLCLRRGGRWKSIGEDGALEIGEDEAAEVDARGRWGTMQAACTLRRSGDDAGSLHPPTFRSRCSARNIPDVLGYASSAMSNAICTRRGRIEFAQV